MPFVTDDAPVQTQAQGFVGPDAPSQSTGFVGPDKPVLIMPLSRPKESKEQIRKEIDAKSNINTSPVLQHVLGGLGAVGEYGVEPVAHPITTIQNVLNLLTSGGKAPPIDPNQNLINIPQASEGQMGQNVPYGLPFRDSIVQALTAGRNAGGDVLSGLSNPNVLPTLPLTGAEALGQKALLGKAFVGQMGATLPGAVVDTVQALKDPNVSDEDKKKMVAGLVIQAGATGVGVHEAGALEAKQPTNIKAEDIPGAGYQEGPTRSKPFITQDRPSQPQTLSPTPDSDLSKQPVNEPPTASEQGGSGGVGLQPAPTNIDKGAAARLQELKAIPKPTPEQATERDALQAKSDSVRQQMQAEFQQLKGGENKNAKEEVQEKGLQQGKVLGQKGGEVQPAPPVSQYFTGVVDSHGAVKATEHGYEKGNLPHESFGYENRFGRWRYNPTQNRVNWTDTPSVDMMDKVDDFLAKKSIVPNSHQSAWDDITFREDDDAYSPAPLNTSKTKGQLDIKPGMSAADVLSQINPTDHGEQQHALAQHLLENFGPALMTAQVSEEAHPLIKDAAYDPEAHKLNLNTDERDPVPTTLHEAAHAATVWVFQNPRTSAQKAGKAEINRLWQLVRSKLPDEVNKFLEGDYSKNFKARQIGQDASPKEVGEMFNKAGVDERWNQVLYGLTHPHEFIAEMYSNPVFRELMGTIEDKGSNVLTRTWNAFKEVLGIKPGTVAEKAFDAFEKLGQAGEKKVEKPQGTQGELFAAPPIIQKTLDSLEKTRDDMKSWLGGFNIRHDTIPRMMDAAQNKANIAARQTANDVRDRLKTSLGVAKVGDKEDIALSMAVEAKGDVKNLDKMQAVEKDGKVKAAIDFAKQNFAKLKPVVDYVERVNRYQVGEENKAGIPTEFRAGYVPHVTDLSDVNSVLFDRSSAGTGSGAFTKERVFDTFAEGRAAGTKYESLKATDLLEHRMRAGQNRINTAKMVSTLKEVKDPTSGLPIIRDMLIKKKKGGEGGIETSAPAGYKPLYLGNHVVAISKPYWGLLDTLTATSSFDNTLLGRVAMQAASTAKHSALLFDLYHPIRLFFYSAPLRSSLDKPLGAFESSKPGLFVLDYNKETLQRMASQGEIPQALLPELIRKKESMGVALRTGFNVGRINDALYTEFLRKIPGIGTYNKWLFDKFQRGVMMEAYDMELQRVMKQEPGLSQDEAGRKVSTDLNKRFGNLMNQSWIKSKTLTDVARLLFLAPQWNEGLVRSELGAGAQGLKVPYDLVTKRKLITGGLVRGAGILLAGQFVANQLLNLYTRGKPTWENDDKYPGAKISAWVPDELGKGPGFWVNPLSLTAEVTKELVDRAEKDKSVIGAVDDVVKNKESSLGRVANVLATREDWRGNKLKDWDVIKEAFKEGLPLPIQTPAVVGALKGKESYPGEAQKTLMAGLGVKTDIANQTQEEKLTAAAKKMFPGKDFDKLTLLERKRLQASLPVREATDDRAKESGAVKAIQGDFERKRELVNLLSKPARAFLQSSKLELQGYEPELGQKVKMTETEQTRMETNVVKEYQKVLDSLEDDAWFNSLDKKNKQRVLDTRLKSAREKARRSVLNR